MKRIFGSIFVAIAILVAASPGNAFASANPANNGKAADAPGQAKATDNCTRAIINQSDNGVAGGHQQSVFEPTNCDHFFQL